MTHRKKLGFLILLFMTTLNGKAGDTVRINSFNTWKLLTIENPWLNSGNAAGLEFNPVKNWSEFSAGSDYGNGEFHRIREAGNRNRYFFNVSSLQSFTDRFSLEGNFSYHFMNDKGARWNGIYDPYSGNPYILADSLSGTSFHRESYEISGKIAYKHSDRLTSGTGIEYYARVGAKQKDPRPATTVCFFGIHPSIILKKDNYKLGLDLGFGNREEQIDYETMRSNFTPVFFMFKGFGFYSKEIDYGFTRFQSSKDFTGGVQLEKETPWGTSLAGLRLDYGMEEVTDGSSVIKKEDGGEWEKLHTGLSEKLTKKSGNTIRIWSGKLDFDGGFGKEFLQDVIYTGNHEEYITIAKNLKFKRSQFSGDISYNYVKLKEAGREDWNLQASLNMHQSTEKYFYIPEVFHATFLNLTGNINWRKEFYTGIFQIAPGLEATYKQNLSDRLYLSELPEINSTQRTDVFMQEFRYYCSEFLKVGGSCVLGFVPGSIHLLDQIYLELKADFLKAAKLKENYTTFGWKLAFVF